MSFCEGCLQEKKKESNFCQSCGCKLAEEKVTEVSEKRNKIVHFITRALEILFFLSIIALWILYTRNPDWEVNKAKEEFKRKNYQRAINYCEKALNLRSDNKEAHEVLLNIYLVLRDNKNAREELNILLKLGVPGNENYMTWGDGFHECKDYSSAAKCYEKVLETKPEELEILKKIAECYKNSWQKQKAGEIYLNIGNSYLETQKFEEAEKYFKYALELNNQNLHIREGLSICYIKKKDYPEAIKVLKEIKNKINDKNKLEDINKQLVECYLILGNQYISHNTDEATTYFKKALTLDKGNVLAKDNLNKCGDIYLKNIKYYLEKENYKSGKLLCQKVMKFFPEGEYLEKAKNYLKIIEKKEKDKKKKTSHSEEYIIIRR